jgi:hypothetical protein
MSFGNQQKCKLDLEEDIPKMHFCDARIKSDCTSKNSVSK